MYVETRGHIILIVKQRPDKENTGSKGPFNANKLFLSRVAPRNWVGPGISSNRTNKDLWLDISRHPRTVRPKMFHGVNCFSVVNRSEINPGLTPSLKALKAVLGPPRRYPRFNLSPSSSILRSPPFFSLLNLSSSSRCAPSLTRKLRMSDHGLFIYLFFSLREGQI